MGKHIDWTQAGMQHHAVACQNPRDIEHSLINLVEAMGDYALHYRGEFPDSKVGGDGVLGEYWLQIARGVAGLLNGPIGRLDAGTMDAAIRDMAREEGFSAEEVDTI